MSEQRRREAPGSAASSAMSARAKSHKHSMKIISLAPEVL